MKSKDRNADVLIALFVVDHTINTPAVELGPRTSSLIISLPEVWYLPGPGSAVGIRYGESVDMVTGAIAHSRLPG